MQIQVNTDRNVDRDDRFNAYVARELEQALDRFVGGLTRLEVHFSDVNGAKFGIDDKRCLIEARLAGSQPVVASDEAGSVEAALRGATRKLVRVLDTTFAKRTER